MFYSEQKLIIQLFIPLYEINIHLHQHYWGFVIYILLFDAINAFSSLNIQPNFNLKTYEKAVNYVNCGLSLHLSSCGFMEDKTV